MKKPSIENLNFHRRRILATAAASIATLPYSTPDLFGASAEKFRFKYLVGSCMYGYTDLATVLAEVPKTGAKSIDIWPRVHGNQREQIDEMGVDKFLELLGQHNLSVGCLSQYKLGPFGLNEELKFANQVGCHTIVTNAKGPTKQRGTELRDSIKKFIEEFRPTLEAAAELKIDIAIENHSQNIIASIDSIKWLRELCPASNLKFAIAPYHLEQDPELIQELIRHLDKSITIFYAWQHGTGSMEKQPKEKELLQMPGKGPLDFRPIIKALQDISYTGWTEIFMHSFPRGLAVHETPQAVTEEINLARNYLESLLS